MSTGRPDVEPSGRPDSLLVGRQIGGYQVLALLGAGGMGEVYRARDTRLGRVVALKVLQRDRAADPAQQARFRREAQAASALNHPNILAVYDVGVEDGVSFIVTELVDGTSLREVVGRGPVPIKKLLDLATQIAEGLTAAHESGIVHRDLKPENVMVTRDGRAKILDFGLALAPIPTSPPGEVPPHVTKTETGLIQGTVPYMSPEQARGDTGDLHSDQFSLGLMLYEMTTGARAFQRETPVQTLSAIITDEAPKVTGLNSRAPAQLQWLIERCLAKDPGQRYAATRDLAQDLRTLRDRLAEATTSTAAALPDATRRRLTTGILLVVAMLSILTLGIVWWRLGPEESSPDQFFVTAPDGATLAQDPAIFAVSPDGSTIAFIASSPNGNSALWVRPRTDLSARQLPGTEGAFWPYWSADSRFLAFSTVEKKTKKIEVSSGVLETLGESDVLGNGTWNRGDVIVASNMAIGGPLYRISASGGGQPTAVTTLDASRAEYAHTWPYFLPDDRHFIYLARSQNPDYDSVLCVGSLDPMERIILFPVDSNAEYALPGYLIYMRGNTLLAQQFDAGSLSTTGNPVSIAEGVDHATGLAQRGGFSVSQAGGVLAYRPIGETQLAWFDRGGRLVESIGSPGLYRSSALSADEKRLAVSRLDRATGTADIFVMEVARPVPVRFTFDPSEDGRPLWFADGSALVFWSNRRPPPSQPAGPAFYYKASSGAGSDELLLAGVGAFGVPLGFSRDRQSLLYAAGGGKGKGIDLWTLPLVGDRKPVPFLRTASVEGQAQVSPDGRWVAYVSNETSRNNVYVKAFSSVADHWPVSTNGGVEPRWGKDGKEIYYLAPDRYLMAVEVKTDPVVEVGTPTRLFLTRMSPLVGAGLTRNQYLFAARSQRFLINQPHDEAGAPIAFVLNWTALLKR